MIDSTYQFKIEAEIKFRSYVLWCNFLMITKRNLDNPYFLCYFLYPLSPVGNHQIFYCLYSRNKKILSSKKGYYLPLMWRYIWRWCVNSFSPTNTSKPGHALELMILLACLQILNILLKFLLNTKNWRHLRYSSWGLSLYIMSEVNK